MIERIILNDLTKDKLDNMYENTDKYEFIYIRVNIPPPIEKWYTSKENILKIISLMMNSVNNDNYNRKIADIGLQTANWKSINIDIDSGISGTLELITFDVCDFIYAETVIMSGFINRRDALIKILTKSICEYIDTQFFIQERK